MLTKIPKTNFKLARHGTGAELTVTVEFVTPLVMRGVYDARTGEFFPVVRGPLKCGLGADRVEVFIP